MIQVMRDGRDVNWREWNAGGRHLQVSPPLRPHPPRMKNFRLLAPEEFGWTVPLSIGPDGTWYGANGPWVRKSTDGGLTYSTIFNLQKHPDGHSPAYVANILALDNGALVVTTYSGGGQVWVSNADQTEITLAIQLTPRAVVPREYGFTHYDNIIFLSEYGSYHAVDTPRKVYRSLDYGQTWETVLELPQGHGRHIHTVAFDPWANRVWVGYGDSPVAGNIMYSDDYGLTWSTVHAIERVQQSTGIYPRPHCVLFGSDEEPDGIHRWERDPFNLQSEVRPEDIRRVFAIDPKPGINPLSLGGLALTATELDGVLYIPWQSYQGRSFSRIIATPDDEHFYEVYRLTDPAPLGIARIIGIDGNGKMRGLYNPNSTDWLVWVADPPTWE